MRRVGADNPQRLDLAVGGGLEHLHGALARLGRHFAHAPQRGNFGAVLGVAQLAVRAQQMRQRADLAPAHGVGLAGERERPRAWLADLPRSQVQVDQRAVLVGAAAALVEALAVQAERGCASAGAFACALAGGVAGCVAGYAREPARRLHDVVGLQAADLGRVRRRELAHPIAQRGEARGVRVDVGAVCEVFPQHDVQQRVVQHDVGARQQRQVQVGLLGGLGAARVGDDDSQRRVDAARVFDAAEQHRVRPGHVRSGDEEGLRQADVVVAGGHGVGTQAGLVAGHGRAHAQARIGVDVVGMDEALAELVEDVVVLGQHLARKVQAHGIGPARLNR